MESPTWTKIIAIVGASGSGKSSVVERLKADPEISPSVIQVDHYYRDLSHLTYEQRDSVNFDHPDAIEFEALREDLKALKRGKHFKTLSADERHRVRLAIKKLRYAVDFLLPMYGQRKATKRYFDRLADLQEELGTYNDMAVTSTLLTGLKAGTPDSGNAAAAIAGWQAHAMVGAESRLRSAWSDFAKMKMPWATDDAA